MNNNWLNPVICCVYNPMVLLLVILPGHQHIPKHISLLPSPPLPYRNTIHACIQLSASSLQSPFSHRSLDSQKFRFAWLETRFVEPRNFVFIFQTKRDGKIIVNIKSILHVFFFFFYYIPAFLCGFFFCIFINQKNSSN